MPIFVHTLKYFDEFRSLCNDHPNQDQNILITLKCSVVSVSSTSGPTPPCLIFFCHCRLVLPVLEFPIGGVSSLLSLASVQQSAFEIHSFFCMHYELFYFNFSVDL